MNLRCDSHAQLEIRQYANVIAGIVKQCCPITFEAWEDYTFGSVTFSRQEMMALQKMMGMMPVPQYTDQIASICEKYDMNRREIDEFIHKLESSPRKFDIDLPEAKPYVYFQEEHHEKNNKMAEPTPGN
jgi:hypothetical protein